MKLNKYSQPIFQSSDLIELMYSFDDLPLDKLIVERDSEVCNLYTFAGIQPTFDSDCTLAVDEFDSIQKNAWRVPPDVLNFDIKSFCLDQCNTEEERARVNEELEAFAEKGLLQVLNVLKYIVDTLRANNVVWGVGRGSSVSSYVLFIIGIHKINSIMYNLDYRDFLR